MFPDKKEYNPYRVTYKTFSNALIYERIFIMFIDDEIKALFQDAVPANNNLKKESPCRSICKKIASYVIMPLLLSIFLYTVSFTSDIIQHSVTSFSQDQSSNNNNPQFITVQQSDEIKQTVSKVAIRESKHPNTIHNELKRLFQYHSYRTITYDNYMKIMPHLKARLE